MIWCIYQIKLDGRNININREKVNYFCLTFTWYSQSQPLVTTHTHRNPSKGFPHGHEPFNGVSPSQDPLNRVSFHRVPSTEFLFFLSTSFPLEGLFHQPAFPSTGFSPQQDSINKVSLQQGQSCPSLYAITLKPDRC